MSDILVTMVDTVAVVTINRPGNRNSMTLSMWQEMAAIFKRLDRDANTRAIILTGAGSDFSTGADIAEFAKVRSDAAQSTAYEVAVDASSDAIQGTSKPTIAVLRGYCLGGGCHLAMACDFRFADNTAQIGIPAARLSIIYGVRSTQRLLSLVGVSAAKRILFSAERFDAEAGLKNGFVDEVSAEVMDAAILFAKTMAANAPLSIAGAKRILNDVAMGLGILDAEAAQKLIEEASNSYDYSEGRNAFAEKRSPNFQGR
ncbi:MAG: enoyl-CoA hydratase/isomerase family protein [Rhizobiales bacterium]|nr:enoyl-CoA hydratase/isomerase family protein [Hyphomicrobiales bacterium]